MIGNTHMTYQRNGSILLNIDPHTSPLSWVKSIFSSADHASAGLIASYLVEAVLRIRYLTLDVRVVSKRVATVQSQRSSTLTVGSLRYHIATKSAVAEIRACKQSLSAGHQVAFLVPNEEVNRAVALAKKSRIEKRISIFGIEDYLSNDIILISGGRKVECIDTFRDVLYEYNRRIQTNATHEYLKITVL